jgi:hypothetical protein
MDRAVLQPHLPQCLHGIGINAGLQRIAPTNEQQDG